MTRKFCCLFIVLAAAFLAACTLTTPTHATTVSYQPLGDFQSWGPFTLDPAPGNPGNFTGTYHLYMLRGISNPKKAADFIFDINRVKTSNNDKVEKGTLMTQAPPEYFLKPDYTKTVLSGNTVEEVPGAGVFFVVFTTGDAPGDTPRHLHYKSATGDSVIMHMLDSKTNPEAGHLDDAFLNKLHSKASDYKNAYFIDGTKK